ncbi:DUF4232 domain-containing protein [Kitasatospora sp. NPDC101183]|uniref:DUF4232 domain-containing protein n=1 Tax=Kitasatospora sp. NPDC101183 TaxID=3364100 RepID=UPI00381C70E3
MRQLPRPRGPFTAPAALAVAAAALLAGCGTLPAGNSAAGSTPSSTPTGPDCKPLTPADTAKVKLTLTGPACTEYELTNGGPEAADLTLTFTRLTAAGTAVESLPHTVTALAPGATDRGRLSLGERNKATHVKVLKVRSVPTSEAPQPGGDCPKSGLRLYADQGDAAMGLRVVGLILHNCGTAPVALDGYPRIQLLDQEHQPVDGIRLLSGGDEIATGTGANLPRKRFSLRPGERAYSTLVWRNTTQDGTPVHAPYARVRALPNSAPVMVTPEFDLGTTGRLGIGAWQPETPGGPDNPERRP